jgi:hypothetical protein
VYNQGGSDVISLPRRELKEAGIDPDQIRGEDLYVQIQDGEMIVDLESAQQTTLSAD